MSLNFNNNSSNLSEEGGHIYYNITIRKKDNEVFSTAQFTENRVQPILKRPQDYCVSVVRFNIPGNNIPLFLWQSGFFITISYQNLDFTVEVQQPQNTPGASYDWYGPAVWTYQDFLTVINEAFITAFNNFNTGTPSYTNKPTQAPFMYFNPETSLFSIYFDENYKSSPTQETKVYMNAELFKYFVNFNHIQSADLIKTKEFVVNDYNGINIKTLNAVDYIIVEQEQNTLALWADLFSIVFETNAIPVSEENLSGQTNVRRRILTDFEPLQQINDRSNIQFYPQGPLRWYDLDATSPLYRIDLNVLWLSVRENKVYPIYLTEYDTMTIKLEFKRKDLYN